MPPELAQKCLQLEARQGRLVDLGVDYYDWARAQGLAEEPWLAAACRGGGDENGGALKVRFRSKGDELVVRAGLQAKGKGITVERKGGG